MLYLHLFIFILLKFDLRLIYFLFKNYKGKNTMNKKILTVILSCIFLSACNDSESGAKKISMSAPIVNVDALKVKLQDYTDAAQGYSSGQAMSEIKKIADNLPSGTTYSWSGISYQQQMAGSNSVSLYAISIIVVFLCLAALYESWSIPISVIMVIPLGVLGAIAAITIRGLDNDVYFQVALLTTIGLSSKNAILIVEFAEIALKNGTTLIESIKLATKERLRPILMTSFAFMAGIFPLAIATGAGANSRIAIGTGILGGTFAGTLLSIFFVPIFFYLVKSISFKKKK